MPVTPRQAGELTVALFRLMRVLMAHHRQAPRGHDDVDPAAQPLLFKLTEGSCRISTLAELTHGEVSTISRHVRNFERLGLVSKDPDPADGRAARVSLTQQGRAYIEQLRGRHAERMSTILASWSGAEVAELTATLERLTQDVESSRTMPTVKEIP